MNELSFTAPCQGVLIITDTLGSSHYQGLLHGEIGMIPAHCSIDWYPAEARERASSSEEKVTK